MVPLAPASASILAVAPPSPDAPPVTTAAIPFSSTRQLLLDRSGRPLLWRAGANGSGDVGAARFSGVDTSSWPADKSPTRRRLAIGSSLGRIRRCEPGRKQQDDH